MEAQTRTEFPGSLDERQLAGTGLRKKSVLGLKSIVIYAFGVYVEPKSLRDKLGPKYSVLSPPALEGSKAQVLEDAACQDVAMSVRLSIVYGSLKIGSVRGAFEESLGGRIKKYTGTEDKQLLQSFTSLFKDDIKLPSGTTIDMTRLPGHLLKTTINGQEVGRVESELLCRCLFDLYIGEDPFDRAGRAAIGDGFVTMLLRPAQ